MARFAIGLAATLAVFAFGAAVFVASGVYDIGADDHHTKLTLRLIESLRDRSIEVRSRSIELRYVDAPERISAGAKGYASLCAGCHLAPGEAKSPVRTGLYPHPPNLVQEEVSDGRRAFWIVKHGIKMSAMPAWGKTLDDAAIWDIVSFIRKMPDMSADQFRQLTNAGGIVGGTAHPVPSNALAELPLAGLAAPAPNSGGTLTPDARADGSTLLFDAPTRVIRLANFDLSDPAPRDAARPGDSAAPIGARAGTVRLHHGGSEYAVLRLPLVRAPKPLTPQIQPSRASPDGTTDLLLTRFPR